MDKQARWALGVVILLLGLVVGCGALFVRGARQEASAPASATPAAAMEAATATPQPTVAPPTPTRMVAAPTPHPTEAPSPSATATATGAPPATVAPAPAPSATTALAMEDLPTPPILLQGDGPEVYLVSQGLRRRIADWETFGHLGYRQEDILVSAALLGAYDDGPPLTRLLEGPDGRLYWLEDGRRRIVPGEASLAAVALSREQASPAPAALILSFPLGEPLPAARGEPTPEAPPAPSAEWVASVYHPIDGGPRLADLFAARADGCCPRRLTRGDGNAYSIHPAWSPDGGAIAYTRCADGSSGSCAIHLAPLEWASAQPRLGGAARQVAELMTQDPAWSPDGQRLAYWSSRTLRLYVADADGAGARDLGPGRGPAWAADGSLVFWAGEEEPYTLSRLDLTGGKPQPVDGRIAVYDQRYYPWRTLMWLASGDPWSPAGQ